MQQFFNKREIVIPSDPGTPPPHTPSLHTKDPPAPPDPQRSPTVPSHPVLLPPLRDYLPSLLPPPWDTIVTMYNEEKHCILEGTNVVESRIDSQGLSTTDAGAGYARSSTRLIASKSKKLQQKVPFLYCFITLLLYYFITLLLNCFIAIALLLYCFITLLLYYFITLLLYYFIALLLYCFITLLLYYFITLLLYCSIALLLYWFITFLLYYFFALLLYCFITLLLIMKQENGRSYHFIYHNPFVIYF